MLRPQSNPTEGLRARLGAGRVVGTFLKVAATEVVDLAASALDFAIVDLEHSQLSESDASRLVRHGFAHGFPTIVRVPTCDPGQVNRLLEAGAAGIQLSSVRRAGDVRALVAATRYPPAGERSVSLAHLVAHYGAIPLADAVAHPPPLLVGQLETAETDDPLEEILAAGLDVAFLGLTDLAVATGFDQARLDARVKDIEEAVAASGVALGAFASDAASIRPDATYVALSSDLALLRAALTRAADDAR
jgi:4-hydroxy-2-oxoheptanedioate aldolase